METLKGDNHQIQLLHNLEFAEEIIIDCIETNDAEKLLDLTVMLGNSHDCGLHLQNSAENSITVFTCRKFNEAKKKGYFTLTTYDMKMESLFNRTCGIVNALSKITPADISYIEKPRVGVNDLNLLPVTVLSAMEPDVLDTINVCYGQGKTVQDWIDEGKVIVKAVSQNLIRLEHHGMGQVIWELIRGDLNEDGVEDILIYNYFYAIGGTFGYGNIEILSRFGSNECFSTANENVQ